MYLCIGQHSVIVTLIQQLLAAFIVCLFVCLFELMFYVPVFRGVALMSWDFYPILGCHDTKNVLHKYNNPSKPKLLLLLCMDGLNKPLFLGRLRLERFTSNQRVGR